MVAAVLTGVVEVCPAFTGGVGNGVGLAVRRTIQCRLVQQRFPLVCGVFLQHIADQVGLRRMIAPLGINQQILLNRCIHGGKGHALAVFYVEPSGEAVVVSRWILRLQCLLQRGAVAYRLFLPDETFTAGGLVCLHILLVAEQPYLALHRHPLHIQADVVIRHSAAVDVFTAREAVW